MEDISQQISTAEERERERIRKIFKEAIVHTAKMPNGNTTLVEVTNDFLQSLSHKSTK